MRSASTSATEEALATNVQLALAARDGRCLVTRNARDFRPLTSQFREAGDLHAGVLLVPTSLPNRRYAEIAGALLQYDREHPGDMPPYMVDYLRRSPLGT